MSFPYMPFYIADYLSKTTHLTTAQHGAYLLLIMHYFEHGKIPFDDPAKLARIVRCDGRGWQHIKSAVMEFFPDGQHARINEELAKAKEKRERRIEAGRAGGMAKAAASNATILPPDLPQQKPAIEVASSSYQVQVHKESKKEYTCEFEEFWLAYPKRAGGNPKAPADRAFRKAIAGDADPRAIIAAALRFAEDIRADGKEGTPYVPMATTWLNAERYNDDYIREPKKQSQFDRAGENLARRYFPDAANIGARLTAGPVPALLLPINGGRGPGDVLNGDSPDVEPVREQGDRAGDGSIEGASGGIRISAIGS